MAKKSDILATYKKTIKARLSYDPKFRDALISEAADEITKGNKDVGIAMLKDYFAAPTEEIPDAEVIESEGDIIILPSSNRPKAYNKLLKLATRVLENKDQATLWLYEPQFCLDGKRPIDHMRTIKGAKDVESLLVRLEYGDCL